MKILVIIPAYNEENSISTVVKHVKLNMPNADVVVVNDCSVDNTHSKALESGATVIDLPFNLGIGGAMQTGYIYAKYNDYDIAIQVDGDGQHDSSFIKQLIAPIETGQADMVIGSRYIEKSSYKSPLSRRAGMVFFSALVSSLTGQKVTDTTSGFRAVNKKVISFFSESYPTDYPEVDVLVKLHKSNFKFMEIPVEMKERTTGKSSITPLRSVYYMVKVSLSLIIGMLRSYK